MNENTQVVPVSDRVIEYVPFGMEEKIKLSVRMVMDIIAVPSKRGNKPTERDCFNFMMLCKSRALNPWEGDAFLIGYDLSDGPTKWNLITSHQAFLKRAEASPNYEGIESGTICKGEENDLKDFIGDFYPTGFELQGAWCKVYTKGRRPVEKRLRLSTYNSGYSRWKSDPAGMIVKCAEADALRTAFPTKLGGLFIREEEATISSEAKFSAPKFTTEIADKPQVQSQAPIDNGLAKELAETVRQHEEPTVKPLAPIPPQNQPATQELRLMFSPGGRRGRPPGSLNKPKEPAVNPVMPPSEPEPTPVKQEAQPSTGA